MLIDEWVFCLFDFSCFILIPKGVANPKISLNCLDLPLGKEIRIEFGVINKNFRLIKGLIEPSLLIEVRDNPFMLVAKIGMCLMQLG